ncbi:hypothetical protein Leryth_024603 [Lithospermum erythrorhizon]|nr:hypothetical protein Leryth_024603 [Lithospermum erythrorhizon]
MTTLAEGISPSGRASLKLSLPTLQSKMKVDPEGYTSELTLIHNQFKSSVELFQQQAALSFTSVSGIGADPELSCLLVSSGATLPSGLRVCVTQALILLINRKFVDVGDTLALFMELQTLGDRVLRKLAFSHVVNSIVYESAIKNDPKNRALQNILFTMPAGRCGLMIEQQMQYVWPVFTHRLGS